MSLNLSSILSEFVRNKASDCYFTVGAPPSLRFGQIIHALPQPALNEQDLSDILVELLNRNQLAEFEEKQEFNTAIVRDGGRFRMNAFKQRNYNGIVLRRIRTTIPRIDQLGLPPIYGDLIVQKRGLILVVGGTGSGKSTSLAAMLGHRNTNGTAAHIVTVEDPIEFVHEHKLCLFTQRDVGIDTVSFAAALKNTLRQAPDIIVIGEIRDRETMEHAITFAETGHLCVATLHANNSNQAIERALNFFPEEKHKQVLSNLSLNLRAILSQRLMNNTQETRSLAVEVMLNRGIISDLIAEGRVKEIREHIEKGRDVGMQSFDQSLMDLFVRGMITEQMALSESDNPANLRLSIKQHEMSSGNTKAQSYAAMPMIELPGRPQF